MLIVRSRFSIRKTENPPGLFQRTRGIAGTACCGHLISQPGGKNPGPKGSTGLLKQGRRSAAANTAINRRFGTNTLTDLPFLISFVLLLNFYQSLKNAEKVILLLPAGNSVHIEAGVAYGLGKPLILIGEPEKPETLYLIFKESYKTIDEFLKTI